ncbi:apolipoprotein D-like [Vanessa atalanta]|uniref:apolipoprotein D-like n=1 Tax=Vanessa atalanta TaxID=42275 RepID=UPI001FCDF586|nr:apolipoprotein D-like [Vanessa atalanta]
MLRFSVLLLVATASAQIPSLGWCPDYQPMANFNVNRFLGAWYEAERYFTVAELGTRCVTTKYESTPEGRILVSNEITNSLTGMKRVMEGSLQMIGREGEGRMIIKYPAMSMPNDNEYSILETDYDNYAVMWSCSGIGPVHIQNAWILTRERLAPSLVMQSAYAVLDRYKISRTFFVKTNQADCSILPNPAADPMEIKNNVIEVIMDAKNAPVSKIPADDVPTVDDKIKPEVKSEIPQERSAIPEIPAEPQPMMLPEISEKKDEKMDKPEEMKDEKPEMEKDIKLKQ